MRGTPWPGWRAKGGTKEGIGIHGDEGERKPGSMTEIVIEYGWMKLKDGGSKCRESSARGNAPSEETSRYDVELLHLSFFLLLPFSSQQLSSHPLNTPGSIVIVHLALF